jgi:NAD-dependent dihydropyrimidine dehydrogenase PreA subunit
MYYYIIGTIVVLWFIASTIRHLKGKGKIISGCRENCIGCKKCLKICRRNVLKMEKDENGTYIIVQKPENCTACGDCAKVCKFNALKLIQK